MKLGGRQTDLTAVQPPGPHSMPWRCFLEGIIYYTNGQSSWASVRFHILCLYRTWTVWRWFHPGVNINRFQQLKTIYRVCRRQLVHVWVAWKHMVHTSQATVLPQDLLSMHMGSYLSVCGRSVLAHPERPKSLDAQVPSGNRIYIVPTHPLVHVQLCPDSSLVMLWCLGNNRTHACPVQTRSFC